MQAITNLDNNYCNSDKVTEATENSEKKSNSLFYTKNNENGLDIIIIIKNKNRQTPKLLRV